MCECKKNDKYQVCSLNNFSDTVRGWRLMFQRWGKASIVFLKGKPSLQKKCFANGHCPFEGVAGGRPLYVWFGPLLHQVIVLNKLIDSSLTITRAQPGNETVFLKPSSKFRLYSREENVSTSTDTENLDVDFKVFVPLPVLKMSYIDEDLHIRRQLTVELTGNGRMVQCEVLYDKLKNTVTIGHWPSWVRHWLRFPTMPFPCTRWLLKSQLWHLMLERRLEQWNQGSKIAALSAATLVKVTLDPLANYVIWINVNCFCIIAWAWNFEDALTWNDCGALSQIHQHELHQYELRQLEVHQQL